MLSRTSLPLLALLLAVASCADDGDTTPARDTGASDATDTTGDTTSDAGSSDAFDDTTPIDADPLDVADDADATPPAPEKFDSPGPWVVGNTTFEIVDPEDEARVLRVEAWFPAVMPEPTPGARAPSILDFEFGERETALAELLAAAPAGCVRTEPGSHRGAEVLPAEVFGDATFATVVFSHCHVCTRYSSYSVAERLASHGIVVFAMDHEGNTLFDELAGNAADVTTAFLEQRRKDVTFVTDAILDPTDARIPSGLRGRLDPTRLGVMGHSFGGVTAGRMVQTDPRFRAGLALAVPMENPLLAGVKMTEIDEPVLFLRAQEDNSITAIGNQYIERNWNAAVSPAWLVDVADLGHWGVSDIAAIIEAFRPGCGDGKRMTNRRDFTYLHPDIGRAIAASTSAAFFALHLLGDEDGRRWLDAIAPAEVVTSRFRAPE